MDKTMICEVCGKAKPASFFSKSYKHRCKECVAEDTRNKRLAERFAKDMRKQPIILEPPYDMWEQRRYEIAARMFPDILAKQREICELANNEKLWKSLPNDAAAQSVKLADALINELKNHEE